MFRPRFALALFVLLPSVLLAQGGKKGKMGGDAGDKGPEWEKTAASTGLKLANKDVESTSPIKMLMDKKKDLKLSEDVVKQLKDIDAKDKDKNRDLFKQLDSLRGETKMVNEADEGEKIKLQLTLSVVASVVKDIRANYTASFQSALPLLDDSQKGMANTLVLGQTKESDDMLKEKMGTKGGRPSSADAPAGGRGKGGKPPLN